MINLLDNISDIKEFQIGSDAYDLWKIFNNNLKVETTIIISHDEFLNFKASLQLSDDQIKIIKDLIDSCFINNVNSVCITCSENCFTPGIVKSIKVSKSIFQIKYAIEKILRSYWKEEAIAWRLVNKKSDTENIPGIIIQPSSETYTLATRSSKTGVQTNNNNLKETNSNNIKEWHKEYSIIIQRIEKALTYACNIYFRFDQEFIIYLVYPQDMDLPAYLHCITDLLDNNIIDSAEYLMRLQPHNFDSIIDVNEKNKDTDSDLITVEGKSLNNGLGIGKIIIPDEFDIEHAINYCMNNKGKYIVACEFFEPNKDWVELLKYSSGIITNRGGLTCHLAIIAREIKIPAILIPISINAKEKFLLLESGQIINEFSNTAIFPNKKVAIFNTNACSDSFMITKDLLQVYLRLIAELITKQLSLHNITQLEESKRKHFQYLFTKIMKVNIDLDLGIQELRI